MRDSRPVEDCHAIRRRRQCPECEARFTTFERVQLRELTVIKANGQRDMFDREKIAKSLRIALHKRPVSTRQLDGAVSRIVQQLEASGQQDISSRDIGETVMEVLKELDQVAYVRFASVYKNFADAEDFSKELKKL